MVSKRDLAAAGLSPDIIKTYRLYHSQDPPLSFEEVAGKVGVKPQSVKRRIAQADRKLGDKDSLRSVSGKAPPEAHRLETQNPKKFGDALVALSDPTLKTVAAACREAGITAETGKRILKRLESDLRPVGRNIADVRLEDMVKRLGTLARDAVDAITPEKLEDASARDLAVVMGVATDKWQLLRGQPTQRTEISDRREMNVLMQELLAEAKRRHIEIDITPDLEVIAKPSPFRSMKDQKTQKAIRTGDPVETLAPA